MAVELEKTTHIKMASLDSSQRIPQSPSPASVTLAPEYSRITNKMASNALVPCFSESIIEDGREDGYWVETFHFSNEDSVPGVIA